ncbi:hypothetical protein ACQ4M3_05675 [Leptolyngbya sp. AN03gr2]|uniref:hypothetical protein n=1 Tax=unclassified Leptolyngbya TaxID=2650499 RepID=UPI003D313ABC
MSEETSPNLDVQLPPESAREFDPRVAARNYILHYYADTQSTIVDQFLEISSLAGLLQIDLAHHFQLLEHPYIVDRLQQSQQSISLETAVLPLQQRPPVQFTQLLNVQATPAQAAIAQALYQNYQQWSDTSISQQAEAYIGEAQRQISDSDRPAIATQIWQRWHRDTKLVHNALAPPDLQMARLIFLSFKDIIQTHLQTLQFTKLKIGGLQSFALDLSKSVSVQVGYDSNRDPPKKRWLWIAGQKFGYLTAESPQLPVGASAIATVDVLDNPHIIAQTMDGLTLSIRTHDPISPSHELLPLEIVDHSSSTEKPLWSVKLNGQIVGILSRSTLKSLRAQNQLYPGKTFWVTVERQPPKTAWINLDPNHIVYPTI